MQSLRYYRWCPPSSSLEIEFPEKLISALRPDKDEIETTGTLYGVQQGRDVRVATAQPQDNLDRIGIFFTRARGEVFLTESNLELFERNKVAVALVRAGSKAGFFVREPDGSIQSVRSHEEFPVTPKQTPSPTPRIPKRKPVWAVAGFFALTIPLLAFFRPEREPKLEVHQQADQLRISWTPGKPAVLVINDGPRHLSVPVPADQSTLTYQPDGGEVEVALTTGSRQESAVFLSAAKPEP